MGSIARYKATRISICFSTNNSIDTTIMMRGGVMWFYRMLMAALAAFRMALTAIKGLRRTEYGYYGTIWSMG